MGYLINPYKVSAASEQWIPTLDGTTPDSDGVTRTQSTSGAGIDVWTTTHASVMTMGSGELLSYTIGSTGEQAIYTKMPFALSITSFVLDWTVTLGTGNRNNTNVFLTTGSFAGVDYSPSVTEGNEYFEVVANADNTNWHIRSRAYPTGESQSSITYGSQGGGGQAGGNQTSSTNYYRLTGDSTTITAQLFDSSARDSQIGADDILTFDGSQWGLGNSFYIGIATDDFATNMGISAITVTN